MPRKWRLQKSNLRYELRGDQCVAVANNCFVLTSRLSKVGNLFECVLSQTFYELCPAPPSEIFRRLRTRNPSPYGFLINLGEREFLVGASPEMFVRCERQPAGLRIETCPISGW
jgi:anthranilate/para-aminobenzoate synthase component I